MLSIFFYLMIKMFILINNLLIPRNTYVLYIRNTYVLYIYIYIYIYIGVVIKLKGIN
jgi:hypothetical protein